MKKALITGITGQDGSYLAELLLAKGYEVHGVKRRASSFNTSRIDHLYEDPHQRDRGLHLHYGDLADSTSLMRILEEVNPEEIYNLGAQTHVGVSFDSPEYTGDVNGLGTLRLLEGIRFLGLMDRCRFYQASTSELFGLTEDGKQSEKSSFRPRSPYAVAKLYAYWITVTYREAYGLFACNGILFNHESERRGETFVTRKITRTLARIFYGLDSCLYLGNLDARRDWGHARDFVEMQWLMLQQDKPLDYVVATGVQSSVREFLECAALKIGIEIEWKGSNLTEIGVVKSVEPRAEHSLKAGHVIIRIDEKYFRPSEVPSLLGDSGFAAAELGWTPKVTIDELINEMMTKDLLDAKKEKLLLDAGYGMERRYGE